VFSRGRRIADRTAINEKHHRTRLKYGNAVIGGVSN
jgi:hypothetical protein